MATGQEQPRGDVLLEWTFPEFVRHERSRGWYLGYVALIVLLLIYAIWTKNYTFAAVIGLASLVLLIRLRRIPPEVVCAIQEEGLAVGNSFYPWKELKEFWILYQPPEVKKVFVNFKNQYRPTLDISLEQQNPLEVRQVISDYLPENTAKEDESGTDQLTRLLKI